MPKKILVVEDNEQNRILMRQILTYHGYEVLEATDGRRVGDGPGAHARISSCLICRCL